MRLLIIKVGAVNSVHIRVGCIFPKRSVMAGKSFESDAVRAKRSLTANAMALLQTSLKGGGLFQGGAERLLLRAPRQLFISAAAREYLSNTSQQFKIVLIINNPVDGREEAHSLQGSFSKSAACCA